jgi:hypothetical protein
MDNRALVAGLFAVRAQIDSMLTQLTAPAEQPVEQPAAPIKGDCQHQANKREVVSGFGSGTKKWRCVCGATGEE